MRVRDARGAKTDWVSLHALCRLLCMCLCVGFSVSTFFFILLFIYIVFLKKEQIWHLKHFFSGSFFSTLTFPLFTVCRRCNSLLIFFWTDLQTVVKQDHCFSDTLPRWWFSAQSCARRPVRRCVTRAMCEMVVAVMAVNLVRFKNPFSGIKSHQCDCVSP